MSEELNTAPNKLMGVLSYFGILWLIPFFMVKEKDEYMKCHLKQGFGLFVLSILQSVLATCAPRFIVSIIGLLFFVLWLIGIINAGKGEIKKLPLVGDLLDQNVTFVK